MIPGREVLKQGFLIAGIKTIHLLITKKKIEKRIKIRLYYQTIGLQELQIRFIQSQWFIAQGL